MKLWRIAVPSVVISAWILPILGCGGSSSNSDGAKPIRTDVAPIQRRFSTLSDVKKATWVGGALGSTDGLPGPTDVYYRGFVWIGHPEAEKLRGLVAGLPLTRKKSEVIPPDMKWADGPGMIDLASSQGLKDALMPKNAKGEIGIVSGVDVLYFDLVGR